MCSQVLKYLCILLTASSISLANEGGGEKEAPKGEGEGEGKPAAPQIRTTEESFSVVQARVSALEAKIRSSEAEIKKLIEEKQATKDPKKVTEIIQQIVQLHKQTEENIKEYDQQRALLKYRYPEKGQIEKREYERIELKSVEDLENQMSLGSSVKRTLKKVRAQYESDKKDESGEAKPKKKKAPATPPSLVDPVILKK